MNIQYNLTQPVCTFAAQELTAYLNRMGRPTLNYELMVCDLAELSKNDMQTKNSGAAVVCTGIFSCIFPIAFSIFACYNAIH